MMMRSGERRHNRQCVRASVTPSSSLYYQQNTTLLTVHTSNTLQLLVILSRHTLWWWWSSCVAIHKSSIGDESALHWWAGAAVEECVNSLWHQRAATHQLPCDASNVNLIYFFSCCQQIVLSQGRAKEVQHMSLLWNQSLGQIGHITKQIDWMIIG